MGVDGEVLANTLREMWPKLVNSMTFVLLTLPDADASSAEATA
jgi:hypothetical protein